MIWIITISVLAGFAWGFFGGYMWCKRKSLTPEKTITEPMPSTCNECRWYMQCALDYGSITCRNRLAAVHIPIYVNLI